MTLATRQLQRRRRHRRVRAKIVGTAARPRLSVFRSNRGVLLQLIDDIAGKTLVAAAWHEPELRSLKPLDQAHKAGELIAQRAKGAGIDAALFDRGGYQYHGRVKAVAEGARSGGADPLMLRTDVICARLVQPEALPSLAPRLVAPGHCAAMYKPIRWVNDADS